MIRYLYFVAMATTGHTYSFSEVGRLQEYLLKDHNPTVRPILNQSQPIQVTISLTLLTIINFDMTSGRLETMGYIISAWRDELLLWNDTEFKDIQSLPMKDVEIWTPGVTQLDAVIDQAELISTILLNDGYVVQAIAKQYTTFCDLDMTFYPVDEHICSFELLSVNYQANEITLIPTSDDVHVQLVQPHGEWKVIDAYSQQKPRLVQGVQSAGIEIVYVFKRQPSFTVLHKSIPLLVLYTADLFTHIVPLNSGERNSFAVTVLLAFVFWQAVVAEELPQNSSNISFFSASITSGIIVSGCSTVLSVILCRIAHFDENREIPETLQKWSRLCRWRKKLIRAKILKSRRENSPKSEVDTVPVENGDVKKELRRTNSESSCTQSIEEEMLKVKVTWVEAATGIDIFFLMVHAVFFFLSVFGFLLIFML